MPETDPTDEAQANSAPEDTMDTAEAANETTSTADAGNDLSEDQKGALAAGVADPDSDASLTD